MPVNIAFNTEKLTHGKANVVLSVLVAGRRIVIPFLWENIASRNLPVQYHSSTKGAGLIRMHNKIYVVQQMAVLGHSKDSPNDWQTGVRLQAVENAGSNKKSCLYLTKNWG